MSTLFVITLCVLIHYNLFLTLFAILLCILPLAIMLLMGEGLSRREQKLSVGTVVIFINCCNYLMQPIQTVPQDWANFKAARGLVEKMARIAEENVREDGSFTVDGFHEALTLRSVTFGYETEKAVLKNVSLTLSPGQKYALVGTSGSGKSTLLNLLMGAHSDYSGSILLDGLELKEINTDSLYDVMNLIGQEVFLFNDTIRNNITMFGDFPAGQASASASPSPAPCCAGRRSCWWTRPPRP